MRSFFGTLIFFTVITTFIVPLDLFLNPWLTSAVSEWQWWNFFTSRHVFTALFLTYGVIAIPLIGIGITLVYFALNTIAQYVSNKRT